MLNTEKKSTEFLLDKREKTNNPTNKRVHIKISYKFYCFVGISYNNHFPSLDTRLQAQGHEHEHEHEEEHKPEKVNGNFYVQLLL